MFGRRGRRCRKPSARPARPRGRPALRRRAQARPAVAEANFATSQRWKHMCYQKSNHATKDYRLRFPNLKKSECSFSAVSMAMLASKYSRCSIGRYLLTSIHLDEYSHFCTVLASEKHIYFFVALLLFFLKDFANRCDF